MLGKSNMAEWAFEPDYSIGSAYGVVRNPYAMDHFTGGSSGGTAAGAAPLCCAVLLCCSRPSERGGGVPAGVPLQSGGSQPAVPDARSLPQDRKMKKGQPQGRRGVWGCCRGTAAGGQLACCVGTLDILSSTHKIGDARVGRFCQAGVVLLACSTVSTAAQ